MFRDEHLHRLRSARERLRVVESALLRPTAESWHACAPELEAAAGLLGSLEAELRRQPPSELDRRAAIRDEVAALRRDLRRVSALLEGVSSYYAGLAELFGLTLRGYSPEGRVVPFTMPVQVSLEA